MSTRTPEIVRLSEMRDGQEADLFALLTTKEELRTRDGKPYFKVAFRDAEREVAFPVWNDARHAQACRDEWSVGSVYKLRATFRETNYGPQLEISKIREAEAADADDGFDPTMFLPRSRFDTAEMFTKLMELANEAISSAPLRRLVETIYEAHREALLTLPAATRHHHAFVGGFLEHVLNVTRNCVFFADRYAEQYPEMSPPLDKSLVVAGGMLHDIGKLRELDQNAEGAAYSTEGQLVGHVLLGRDIVRDHAHEAGVEGETLLRLEHIIISHQRLPEWGSPKPPMTPEALLVHYADDVDAKFEMVFQALADERSEGPFSPRSYPLGHAVFRGE